METKSNESTLNSRLARLTKEELINELENAQYETVKYVNRFLEVQEKWMFINLLLKKLNAIKDKKELCNTISDGFLKLTNSKICICRFFNNDTTEVEFEKISTNKETDRKTHVEQFGGILNSKCQELIQTSAGVAQINEYFDSLPKGNHIISPIVYNNHLLGYFAITKEDKNFYRENSHFVEIFIEHVALILENISLYQESERRNRSKIEFLAGISHEFKTPLNSIIGFSEILKLKNYNVENYKYIENISQSSKHLLGLIEDILDVTKSQYNTLELNHKMFNPKEIITQVLSILEEMLKEKSIDLSYTLLDIEIKADIKRFKQVIYNLVSNAAKFNKQNGKINIITYLKDDYFFFEIKDTGDGISKKDHDKIFEFFTQVNRNQLKRQLGSGIGLALCKNIIESHKGEIGFSSRIKEGSCFWFKLPVNKGLSNYS